jgi:hypothetical protein
MTREKVRFTAYLSVREREGITVKAAEYDASDNYIVRLAIREFLGLSLKEDVTLDTRNKQGEPA